MLGMKVARTADPSMGIRNRAPAPRWQRWSEGEARGKRANVNRRELRIPSHCNDAG
jgi:hypothetical protein